MSYNYHIYSMLKKYAGTNKRFHVPGHKARGDFKSKFPVAAHDITELSYSDNLACPTGAIAAAQRDLAEIVGAKRSYILTDGSSAGVLASICSAAKRGSKMIVPRNSHLSVWNACKMWDLEPVIVQGEQEGGLMTHPAPALIEELVKSDITISCMIVTSPDYYGRVAPLREYARVLHAHGRYLVVDGAHGAHLCLEKGRAGHAGAYADVWVDGAHKTLPTLTQGALVSTNRDELIPALEEHLATFRTTSPSYPIMASVEYGFKYFKNNPTALETAKAAVAAFKETCPVGLLPTDDWTKIVADFSSVGISADKAVKYLEKRGIYSELSDGRYVLFYASPQTTAADLKALNGALTGVVNDKNLTGTYRDRGFVPAHDRTYSFQYAIKRTRELIPIDGAIGRMCAVNAGVAPPCTAVVAAGEIITKQAAEILLSAPTTFGLVDGNKIWVVLK